MGQRVAESPGDARVARELERQRATVVQVIEPRTEGEPRIIRTGPPRLARLDGRTVDLSEVREYDAGDGLQLEDGLQLGDPSLTKALAELALEDMGIHDGLPTLPTSGGASAESVALAVVAKLGGLPVVAAPVGESVEAYAKRWLTSREGRVNSIRDDRSRLRDHVLPLVASLDVATFTKDDVENVRDALDGKIASGALNWKTARNAWAAFCTMCSDMGSSKRRDLRVRKDNPAIGVHAPDRGARKVKQYLFPSELLLFVSCEEVPFVWRRNLAVAVYTYLRDGELRELRWEDVDLEHAVISISHAYNRRSKASKDPKTAAGVRRVPIHPNLLPLLRAMHAEAKGDGLVCTLPSERTMARSLRRWLRRARVMREALYEATPTRKPITWHDARATGITWLAVEGVPVAAIQRRAGHTTIETTMGYVREAEVIKGDAFGTPFPALPESLLRGPQGTGGGGGEDGPGGFESRPPRNSDPSTSWTEPAAIGTQPAASDVVTGALAYAIRAAAEAGQWALVAQLARELEARRVGGAS